MDATDDGNLAQQQPLAITITSARELGSTRAAIRSWLRGSIPDQQTDEILLASGEALANALEHGLTPITLSLEWTDGTLHLAVRDSGAWRLVESSTREPKPRGLGIPIMTALTDSLTFETTDGTTVKLSRQFGV